MKVRSTWPLVAIHWRDAYDGENGWTDVEKYEPEDTTVVTVGWLWEDCLDGYVTLVNSYFPDEVPDPKTVGMPTHIPVGMVIKMYVIEQPAVDLPDADEEPQKPLSSSPDYRPYPGKFQDATSRPQAPLKSRAAYRRSKRP
jgi:hypothetical protein